MQEEKYRRPLLCRLCEGPIVDRGVHLLAKRRMDKLRRWWKAHFGVEFTKATCPVCYFCVWDLRFADENSVEKEPLDQKWWPPHKFNMKSNMAINFYNYYTEELMKPCSVKISPMATERVLEEMQKSDVGRSFQCVYCPKAFDAFCNLSNHAKSRHRGQVIRCRFALCRQFFLTQDEKVKHLRKEHSPATSFKCFYCGKVSTNKNTHYSHLLMKHRYQIIKCKYLYCSLMFKTEQERDQHFEEKHNIGKYFCCFCDKHFDNPASQRGHMLKFHKEALKCNARQFCPNYFKTEEDRQKHIQEKHPKAKSVKCIYCEKTFLERKQLGGHVKYTHKDAIKCEFFNCCTFFKTEEERQKHKEQVHEKYKFFCVYCDKTVHTKSGNFSSHFQKYHTEEEIIRCDAMNCVTYFKSDEEKLVHTKEMHQSLDENIICIYCNKFVLKNQSSIIHHMRMKHADTSIKCTYHCNTYFKNLEEREKHIKEVHQAERIKVPFPCLYCDKISADFTSFRKHVVLRHLDVAIKCPFRNCGKYFKSQEDLENHFDQKPKHKMQKVVNNPQKPLTCLLCPKIFYSKDGLFRHKKIAHEGQKINCPHCSQEFSTKKHLISVFCQICKKKFLCPGLLRIHNLTCKPDRQCPVCVKVFNSDFHLFRHCNYKHTVPIRQWRGLQFKSLGFKCNKCFVYFKQRSELNSHLKGESHVVFKLTCNFCEKKYANRHSIQRHIVEKHV